MGERSLTWFARAGSVALILLMTLTFFDVIGRAFGHPIVGTVEVTSLLMGLIIFLAIGLTTLQRGHIRVDIVVIYLPPRAQAFLEMITLTICIVFSALLCRQLWLKAADTLAEGDVTQLWAFPVWPVAYVIAFCSITILFGLMVHVIQAGFVAITGKR